MVLRAVIRRVVDIDKPINLRRLSPIDKVIVAVKRQVSVSLFSNAKENRERLKNKRRIEKEDELKSYLLSQIRKELVDSAEVSKLNKIAYEIVVAVEAKYRDIIFDELDSFGNVVHPGILASTDFSQYEISVVEEEADLRRAFKNMPYMIRCRKKVIM